MANLRTSSDFWDTMGDEDEYPYRPYPHATRRRAAFARALGTVGVLGTLALAVAAFAPRMPWLVEKFHALTLRHDAAQAPATNPLQPVRQVSDAKSFDTATPTPVMAPVPPTVATEAPANQAPVETTRTDSLNGPATTAEPAPTAAPVVSDVALPPASPSAITAPSAAEQPATAATAATPAGKEQLVAPPGATAPVTKPAARQHAPAAKKKGNSEPPLTAREIERRQQRYELWLRQQGLERVH